MYVLDHNVLITVRLLVFPKLKSHYIEKKTHSQRTQADYPYLVLRPCSSSLLKTSLWKPTQELQRQTQTQRRNTARVGPAKPVVAREGLPTFPKQSVQALFARDGPIETYLRTPWHTHKNRENRDTSPSQALSWPRGPASPKRVPTNPCS